MPHPIIIGGFVVGGVFVGKAIRNAWRRFTGDVALELESEFGDFRDDEGVPLGGDDGFQDAAPAAPTFEPGLVDVNAQSNVSVLVGGQQVRLREPEGVSLVPFRLNPALFEEDPDDGGDGLGGSPPSNEVTDQRAAQLDLIPVTGTSDIAQIASVIALCASTVEAQRQWDKASLKGTPDKPRPVFPEQMRLTLQNIAAKMVWKTPADGERHLRFMAKQLELIAWSTTDGWNPNTGGWGSSNNEYVVPRRTEEQWYQQLKQYRPADFAMELSVLLLTDMTFKAIQNPLTAGKVVEEAIKVASKYGAVALASAGGGPWAVAGALVTTAVGDLIDALEKATTRSPRVHDLQDKLVNALIEQSRELGLKFPLLEMELYHVTGQRNRKPGPLSTGGYRAFPRHLAVFCQNAVHDAVVAQVYEGVYPAPGLPAYYGLNSGVKFACTDTPDNDISASYYNSAPKARTGPT